MARSKTAKSPSGKSQSGTATKATTKAASTKAASTKTAATKAASTKAAAGDSEQREALVAGMIATLRYVDGVSRAMRDSVGVVEDRDVAVLLLVVAEPGIAPGMIAAQTGAAPSVISRTLGRLEGKDLLTRRAGGADARGRGVWATRHGKARVRAMHRRLDEFFRSEVALADQAIAALRPKGGKAAAGGGDVSALSIAEQVLGIGTRLADGAQRSIIAYDVSNPADRLALVLIDRDGTTRPNQLAGELGLTTGGVTLMLDRMERRDLVRRKHDAVATDRRAVLVVTAPRGRRAVAALVAAFEPLVGDACDVLALTRTR